jgi:hypothetical protein
LTACPILVLPAHPVRARRRLRLQDPAG